MADIFWMIWSVAWLVFLLLQIVIFQPRRNRRNEARRKEHDKIFEDLMSELHRILHEDQMRKHKYKSWFSLSESVRDRISKVRELAIRGVGGEQVTAENKFNEMLAKHGLNKNDIPDE